jgi:flagellin
MLSVNTNYSALVALQNLNETNSTLETTQQRISTGLKVATAKDNGAVFAIAEGQRARVSALSAVKDGVSRASSGTEVALAAGSSVGKILQQLKEKAVAAQNADLTATQRQSLQSDFAAIRSQIDTIVNSAAFNGINLVKGTNNNLNVLTTDQVGTSVNTGSGVQTSTALTAIYSPSALLTSVTTGGTATTGVAAGDTVTFTLTGGGGPAFSVRITAAMTVNDYVNAVTTASGGKILASYDNVNGKFTYLADSATYSSLAITNTSAGSTTGTALGVGVAYAASVTTATTSNYTVNGIDLSLTGSILSSISTIDISTSITTATTASTNLDTAMTTLNDRLAKLGSQAKALDIQMEFLAKLSDSIEAGIGNLVDADLAKESAKLQSLQIKQQLGAQALSIANQSPQVILSLFRN